VLLEVRPAQLHHLVVGRLPGQDEPQRFA
jgi:hypothetical protein